MLKKCTIIIVLSFLLISCGRITSSDRGDGSGGSGGAGLNENISPEIVSIFFNMSGAEAPSTISFTAQVQDDGPTTNLSYLWDFGDGSTANAQNPAHKYKYKGDFTISLLLTDSDGAFDFMRRTGTILQGNSRPAINSCTASKITANIGEDINFSTACSDPDADSITYKWDFGDGNFSSAQNPQHSYSQNGLYTVVLTVTDAKGAQNSQELLIGIGAAVRLPPIVSTLAWTPTTPLENINITFSGGGTDYDGSIISYSWDFGDGSTSTLRNPTHFYTKVGTYQISLTVQDNDGLPGSKTDYISIGIGE